MTAHYSPQLGDRVWISVMTTAGQRTLRGTVSRFDEFNTVHLKFDYDGSYHFCRVYDRKIFWPMSAADLIVEALNESG